MSRRSSCLHEGGHIIACLSAGAEIVQATAPGSGGRNEVLHHAPPNDDGSASLLIALAGIAADQVYGYREWGEIRPSSLPGFDQDLTDAYQLALTMAGPDGVEALFRRSFYLARSFVAANADALERVADLLESKDVVLAHEIAQVVRVEA